MSGDQFAVVVLLLLCGRSFIFTIVAILDLLDRADDAELMEPRVSIVVPAFNEAAVISSTLDALLASQHGNHEVVVVDDGSNDGTRQVVERYQNRFPRLILRSHTENQGKAAALNTGIAATTGAFVATIDADTAVHPDTISRCVRRLSKTGEAAVACHIVPARPANLLETLQDVEYRFGFNIERAAQGRLRAISVLPGAATVFCGDLVRASRFSGRTRTEDADHTLTLSSLGHRLGYARDAVAETLVPATCAELARQRVRWVGGHLQCVMYHCASLFQDIRFTFITYPVFVLLTVAGCAALISGTYLGLKVALGSATFDPLNLLFVTAGAGYSQRLAVACVLREPMPPLWAFVLEPMFTPVLQLYALLAFLGTSTLGAVGLAPRAGRMRRRPRGFDRVRSAATPASRQ